MKSGWYQIICLSDVHIILKESFSSMTQDPFAGLTAVAGGDFFQLPPVEGRPAYSPYEITLRNFDSL